MATPVKLSWVPVEDDLVRSYEARRVALGSRRGLVVTGLLVALAVGLVLVGQLLCRRVDRRPVAPQAQHAARCYLHPVDVLETLDRARLAPDPEVSPAAVDDPLHGGGHRRALLLERGEAQVPGLRQGSEVTAVSGFLTVTAIGDG